MPSSNIDKRIVEMDFDNARFEKNCAQSISTLDKLKNALNLGDAAKGFNQLEKQANGVDFSGLERSISNIEHRFSALGIAGATIVSNLTNKAIGAVSKINSAVFGQMKAGGISRALNLEHANFMMEGLLKDSTKVAEVMSANGPVQTAVRGTAYGLDAAASAAAQFIASGVTDLDKLENALTGISGVAAMTGASYEDIASIFTTVAGQGKVMTMQFRQIEARGLNAAAALSEYLHVSEAEVRDMVTKGKINFETFAEAMNKTFGDQAKKANETFTGAMSNVKAALSRIGAKVATPTIEQVRKIFVDLIDVINNVSVALDPMLEVINDYIKRIGGGIHGILEDADRLMPIFNNLVEIAGNALYDILLVIDPIRKAFRDIVPKTTIDGVLTLTERIKEFTSKLRMSSETANNVRRIFRGLFAVADLVVQAFTSLIKAISPGTKSLSEFVNKFLDAVGTAGDYIYVISKIFKENQVFLQLFEKLGQRVNSIVTYIVSRVRFLFKTIKSFSGDKFSLSNIGNVFSQLADAFRKNEAPLNKVGNFFKIIFGGIGAVIQQFSPLLGSFASVCGRALSQIGHAIETVITGGGFKTLLALVNSAFLTTIGLDIAAFIHHIIGSVSNSLKLIDGIRGLFASISTHVKVMTQSVKADILIKIAKAIAIFAGSLFLLSLIDPEALTRSLIAITVMMGELIGVLYLFTKISDSMNNMGALVSGAVSFAAISAGILLLAGAMKMIAGIDAGRLEAALGVTTALIVELTAVAMVLGTFGSKVKTGIVGIITFAVAVKVLGSAMAQIGALDMGTIIKGLIGITGAVIALSGAALAIGDSKFGVRAGIGILAMAASLKIISDVIGQLGSLRPEELSKGLVAIGAALAEIAVFMTVVGDAKHVVGVAVAIGILSLALAKITEAITSLGQLSLAQLGLGLGGLAVVLVEMGVALKLLATNALGMIGAAAALMILSVSLNALIPILTLFANMNLSQFAMSLGGLALALGVLGAAGAIMGTFAPLMFAGALAITALGAASLVSAAGLAASAIAIGLLASSLETLNSIGWLDLLSSLGKLVVAFTVLGVGTLLLSPLVPTMLGMALALGVFATSCAIAAATVSIAAIGVSLMADALKKFDEISWSSIAKGLVVLVGAMATLGLTAALLTPVAPVILAIGAGIAALGAGALMTATALLLFGEAINVLGPHITNLGNAIAEFASNAFNYITKALTDIWNGLLEFSSGLLKFIADIGAGALKGLISVGGEILKFLVDLGGDMLKSIGVPEDWVNAATNFMKGLIDGLTSGMKGVVDKAKEVGNGMLDGIKNVLKIHSPSEEGSDVGGLFDEGIMQGVLSLKDMVVNAVANVGSGMKDQARADANDVKSIWDELKNYGSTLTHEQREAAESEDKKRSDMRGYNSIDALTRAGQAGQIHLTHKATKAQDEETKSLEKNTKATGGSSKAKKENKKANDKKTKAINEETEALDEETEAVEDNEQEIRDQAEQIEIVTERFKEYLKTFGKTDPLKNATRLTKSFSTLWSAQDKTISDVSKTYKATSKSLTNSFKTINKQVIKFNDSGKYLGKFSKSLYKNSKKIEDRVTKTGKTIMKVMGPTTKVFFKAGNSVEKMVISTTKNVKKLGQQFEAAKNFVNSFNADITNIGDSESFILTLRSIEKYFGANKLKQMTGKVKGYLSGLVNEFDDVRNSMNILAKNVDGVGNVLSKNSKSTAYVVDGFMALAASLYDGSEAANEYETEHARLLFLLEHGLATEEEVAEHFQSYVSRIKDALVEYRTSVQENLTGSMDIWSKFNQNLLEEGTDLISNIESQIAGYYNWSNMLMELSKRGLDVNILKILTDEGVSSFGKAKGLLEMTRAELALFTEDYQMSQAVIEHATDTAIAAMANAQAQASLRAAAAQGNKTAQAQLRQSAKNKKAMMDDIKAVADYRVKYNKLTKKQEKEYLKSLTKEQQKEYKKQVKAAKKAQKEQTKLAKNERAKRAEKERLKGIMDSIKALSDYINVTREYSNDSKVMTDIATKMTEAFKPLQETFPDIAVGINDSTTALFAFGETLEATGEEGLNYFEEIAKRIENFTNSIIDSIKSVDLLSTAFEKVYDISYKTISDNAFSNIVGNEQIKKGLAQLEGMGYNREVIDKLVENIKNAPGTALAQISALTKASADEIRELNAYYDIRAKQAKEIADQTLDLVRGTTSKKMLEDDFKVRQENVKKAEEVQKKAAKSVSDYETKLNDLRTQKSSQQRKLDTLQNEANALKATKKLTATQKKRLKSLTGPLGLIAAQERKIYNTELAIGELLSGAEYVYKDKQKAEEELTKAIAEQEAARRRLAEYETAQAKAEELARKRANLRVWYEDNIKSLEAYKNALRSLARSSDEFTLLNSDLAKFLENFDGAVGTFEFVGNFEGIKSLATVGDILSPVKDGLLEFARSISEFDEGMAFADQIKVMTTALKDYQDSLEGSIRSSSDFFSMFKGFSDEENPLSIGKYLEYANSQVTALKEWSSMLMRVTDLGLNKDLVETLANKGLGSYEQLYALTNATADEIAQYNYLWEEYNKEIEKSTNAAMASIAAAWSDAGKNLQSSMIQAFVGSDEFEEAGYEASALVITGMKNGLEGGMTTIISAVEKNMSSTDMATSLGKSVGKSINEGLVQSIQTSVQDTVDAAIEKFKMAVDSVNEYVNATLQTEFTITVHVDTTEIDEAVARMNAAVSGINADARTTSQAVTASQTNQAQANVTTTPEPTQVTNNVTFNQTNNSPKSLSQVDIYRNTKNQLNQTAVALGMAGS